MSSLPSMRVDLCAKVTLLEGYPSVKEVREYLSKTFQQEALLKEHLDVWFAEPDLKSGSYSIDYIRQVLDFGALAPHELPFKVIVFSRAHLLGELGMNALLKILEEPPPHLYFVLTAPQRSLLLETLSSRIGHVEEIFQGALHLKETSAEKKLFHFIEEKRMDHWQSCLEIADSLHEESIDWENFFCIAWQELYDLKITPEIQLEWLRELKEGKKVYIKERNLILALLIKIRSYTHDFKQKQHLFKAVFSEVLHEKASTNSSKE